MPHRTLLCLRQQSRNQYRLSSLCSLIALLSPKNHPISLLALAHRSAHTHANMYVCGTDVFNASHHAYAFIKLHNRHVVIPAVLSFSSDHGSRIDCCSTRRFYPTEVQTVAVRTELPWVKNVLVAIFTRLNQEPPFAQCAEIVLLRSCYLIQHLNHLYCYEILRRIKAFFYASSVFRSQYRNNLDDLP